MHTIARPDVSHYTYRVSWSGEDNEFVATCLEFPSLSWLASSQVEALEGLEGLLRDTLADMEEQGEEIPAPLSDRKFSGKFNVRVGEHLHRDLAMQAAEEHMSLNQYVVKKLALLLTLGHRSRTEAALGQIPRPSQLSRSPTTLHEAIAQVLREEGNEWMTARQLTDAVNERGLYRKRDGNGVDVNQVHARTRNYGDMFEKDGPNIRLREAS